MNKPYFDYDTNPEVREDTILAFDNQTSGTIHFGEALSPGQQELLGFARSSLVGRAMHPRKEQFLSILPSKEDGLDDLFNAMSLTTRIHPHMIHFGAAGHISEEKALSIIRGVVLLSDVLENITFRSLHMFFRLNINDVLKATADIEPNTGQWDGKVVVKKGWLIPVWNAREIDIYRNT